MGSFEKWLFRVIGTLCLFLLGWQIYSAPILQSNAWAIGLLLPFSIFSFLLSKLSSFKRIKGFGFEAEMWDDVQMQAREELLLFKDLNEIMIDEMMSVSVLDGYLLSTYDKWVHVFELHERILKISPNNPVAKKFFDDDNVRKLYFIDTLTEFSIRLRKSDWFQYILNNGLDLSIPELRRHAFFKLEINLADEIERIPESIDVIQNFIERILELENKIDHDIDQEKLKSVLKSLSELRFIYESASKITIDLVKRHLDT